MAYEIPGNLNVQNNLRGRNFSIQASFVTTTSGFLALDTGTPSNIFFDGSVSGQIVVLPQANDECLTVSHEFRFFNESSVPVSIQDFSHNLLSVIIPGASTRFYLIDQSTPAGRWVEADIQLSKVLVDLTNIVGISGPDAQSFVESYLAQAGLPVINEIPGGAIDCTNLSYTLAHEAIPGTIEPSLGGVKLIPGLDFVEYPNHQGFTIIIDPNGSSRLNSPPHEGEGLLVNYCKRVIF